MNISCLHWVADPNFFRISSYFKQSGPSLNKISIKLFQVPLCLSFSSFLPLLIISSSFHIFALILWNALQWFLKWTLLLTSQQFFFFRNIPPLLKIMVYKMSNHMTISFILLHIETFFNKVSLFPTRINSIFFCYFSNDVLISNTFELTVTYFINSSYLISFI